MKIQVTSPNSTLALKFEELIKTIWEEDFIYDFKWEHFNWYTNICKSTIYIAHHWNELLWGAIVSQELLDNPYSDPWKQEKKLELQKQWYKSLTYLIIDTKFRNTWIAKKLLLKIKNENKKIWLTCKPWLKCFYEKLWFDSYEIEKSNQSTLVMSINLNPKPHPWNSQK